MSELRPPFTFPEEVIRDLDGRELWRGVGPVCRADLRGLDLRGADLRKRHLRGARLRGSNLAGAELEWVDLTHADLTGADLRGATLWTDELVGLSLRNADLRRSNVNWSSGEKQTWRAPVDLCGADLSTSSYGFGELECCVFDDRTRFSPNRPSAALHVRDWIAAAEEGGWRSSPFTRLRDRIGRVAWVGTKSLDEEAEGGGLRTIDLSGVDFRLDDPSRLRILDQFVLDGCDLVGIDLYWALWQGVSARRADFGRGAFEGSSFHDCDLRESWFIGASLGWDNMGGNTRWEGCDLRGARFTGADLCGADLSTCDLDGAELSGAAIDPATSFPRGTPMERWHFEERPLPFWKRDR